jgi:hypothetical protein
MRVALLCLVVFTFACKEKNPHFCETPPCVMVDAAESCSATKPCSTGHCKLDQMICVQCLENAHCMMATAPTCNLMTNTCGPCTKHTDCASNACLPTGVCGTDAEVAYLAPQAGTDNTNCTKAEKCTVFSKALATMKPYIKVEGTSTEAIQINRAVVILGDTSPRSKFGKTSGTIVEATGSGAVTIYDMEINGAANQTIGVSIPTGQTVTLTLDRCIVARNGAGGVIVNSGTLALVNSRVDSNLGGGIQVNGTGTKYTIVNNFIGVNGLDVGVPSAFGGVELNTGTTMGNKFDFNTVAFNKSDGNRAAGIDCGGVASTVNGNIVYANSEPVNGVTEMAQKRGTCTYQTNFVSGVNVGPANDLGMAGARANPFDFKLTSNSPMQVRDVITTACAMKDFEGDARPYGSACDLGADEYVMP